jgi:hypothetical protein
VAERIEAFTVTVPAGTPTSAPTSTPTVFDPGDVERIEVFIPSGHGGLTGFALFQAHNQIIPYRGGQFIVDDDDTISWPVEGFLNTGDWQLTAYNLDVNPHSFYIRFLVNEIRRRATLTIVQAPLTLVGA